ncbi:hypothetical protein [Streptomyces chartreusis]
MRSLFTREFWRDVWWYCLHPHTPMSPADAPARRAIPEGWPSRILTFDADEVELVDAYRELAGQVGRALEVIREWQRGGEPNECLMRVHRELRPPVSGESAKLPDADDQGLAKVGARCMRESHQGRIEHGLAVIEGWRFALSTALDLGTGAPWEAIHERVKELVAQPSAAPQVCPRCEHDERTRGVVQLSTFELYPPEHAPWCDARAGHYGDNGNGISGWHSGRVEDCTGPGCGPGEATADASHWVCPTCGPTATEPHPRLPIRRCSNCKEHVRDAVSVPRDALKALAEVAMWVSRGRSMAFVPDDSEALGKVYPDAKARRALGALDDAALLEQFREG